MHKDYLSKNLVYLKRICSIEIQFLRTTSIEHYLNLIKGFGTSLIKSLINQRSVWILHILQDL